MPVLYDGMDPEQLRAVFDPRLVDRALSSAVKKTALKTRTRASREIRKVYNVKASDVPKPRPIRQSVQSYILPYATKRLGLEKFGMTERRVSTWVGPRKAAYVRVRKDRGRKLVRGQRGHKGFGAPVAGGRLLFERKNRKTALPIQRLTGPAVSQMIPQVIDDISEGVGKELDLQFRRNMDFFLDKAAKR